MNKIFKWGLSVVALLVVACTNMQAPNTSTFNDKAGLGIETVTAVRRSTTALLVAHKITAEQDQLIQAQLTLVRKGIEVAKSIQAGDPQAASVQLTSALDQLDALKVQTGGTK